VSPAALREIAEAVAREAGHQLREAFGGERVNVTAKSSPTDLVSEADHAAERLIRDYSKFLDIDL
jgi:myo-inositol-1(or 4)-monophosphatase